MIRSRSWFSLSEDVEQFLSEIFHQDNLEQLERSLVKVFQQKQDLKPIQPAVNDFVERRIDQQSSNIDAKHAELVDERKHIPLVPLSLIVTRDDVPHESVVMVIHVEKDAEVANQFDDGIKKSQKKSEVSQSCDPDVVVRS